MQFGGTNIRRIVFISLIILFTGSFIILTDDVVNVNGVDLNLQLNNLAADWTEIHPDPSPPGRIHTAMTFDSKRNKIIMFGGNVDGLDNDTWEFDTETNTWTELFPLNSPPVKNYHKMVYHPIEDIIILYGGYTGNSVDSRLTQNTWAFNYTANT